MVPHWRPATTGWFHGIDVLDDAVAWAALVPPDCYPAYAFAKRALQATTMAAIDVAERLDRIGCRVACLTLGAYAPTRVATVS
jgi:hypothetical protein